MNIVIRVHSPLEIVQSFGGPAKIRSSYIQHLDANVSSTPRASQPIMQSLHRASRDIEKESGATAEHRMKLEMLFLQSS